MVRIVPGWCLPLCCIVTAFGPSIGYNASGQTRTLSAVRDLRIEGEFSLIGGLAISRDGVLAIAQHQDGAILFFDQQGKPIGRFGRRGAGPGEFSSLMYIGETEDGFWATDGLLRRLTLVSSSLILSKTIPLPNKLIAGMRPPLDIRASGPSGRLILTGYPPAPSNLGFSIGKAGTIYVSTSAVGDAPRLLATIPSSPHCIVQGNRSEASIKWCLEPMSAVSPNGQSVLVLLPESKSYRLISIHIAGDTAFSKRFAYTPIRIPAKVADDAFARLSEGTFAASKKNLPEFFPPVAALVAGRDGTVWLKTQISAADYLWLVVDGNGNTIGHVELPASVRVLVGERGTLWGVERGADGVESIVRYRIR